MKLTVKRQRSHRSLWDLVRHSHSEDSYRRFRRFRINFLDSKGFTKASEPPGQLCGLYSAKLKLLSTAEFESGEGR